LAAQPLLRTVAELRSKIAIAMLRYFLMECDAETAADEESTNKNLEFGIEILLTIGFVYFSISLTLQYKFNYSWKKTSSIKNFWSVSSTGVSATHPGSSRSFTYC
jgi:hypothetical protein